MLKKLNHQKQHGSKDQWFWEQKSSLPIFRKRKAKRWRIKRKKKRRGRPGRGGENPKLTIQSGQPSIYSSSKDFCKFSLQELERSTNNPCIWLKTGFLVLRFPHLTAPSVKTISSVCCRQFLTSVVHFSTQSPCNGLSWLNLHYTNLKSSPATKLADRIIVLTCIACLLLNLKRLHLTFWQLRSHCRSSSR